MFLCFGFYACGIGDFIGAYFNTYYNAQKDFGDAEDEVWNQPELKQLNWRNYLVQFNTQQNTKTKFTTVIEKCSKLLQYHPESGLVDDALMMIGKSYFYQSDYQRAERKFKELIAGYPNSGLLPEAKLLLACSYYKEGDKASAKTAGQDILEEARKNGDDDIRAHAAQLMGQMELENKNYASALEDFKEAAEFAGSREQRAAELLNVAEMHTQLGHFASADSAYRRSISSATNYLGEYKGGIGSARALAKEGKYNASLDLLEDLRKNTNNKEFFGEIDLEIGNVYRQRGDLDDAVTQYRYVDTSYARTEASANSYYQLGLLYETQLSLYDSARIAYNRGRNEFAQSLITPMIVKRADYLNKYAAYVADMRINDSLRALWLAPRDTLGGGADSAATRDSVRTVPPLDSARALLPRDSNRALAAMPGDSLKQKRPTTPLVPLDTVLNRLAVDKSELATLFFTSIGRTDSALYWYTRLIEDHPRSQLVPRALYGIAQIYSLDSTVDRSRVDSLYRELVSRYPESEFAAEARKALKLPAVERLSDPAELSYKRAEQNILSGKNSEAIDSLRSVVKDYPASPYGARAQFAIGWLYEQVLNQPDSAIVNYQRLRAEYPTSPFAARVQPKLMEVELKDKQAAKDTSKAPEPPGLKKKKKGIDEESVPVKSGTGKPGGADTSGVPQAQPVPQHGVIPPNSPLRNPQVHDSTGAPIHREPVPVPHNPDSVAVPQKRDTLAPPPVAPPAQPQERQDKG